MEKVVGSPPPLHQKQYHCSPWAKYAIAAEPHSLVYCNTSYSHWKDWRCFFQIPDEPPCLCALLHNASIACTIT